MANGDQPLSRPTSLGNNKLVLLFEGTWKSFLLLHVLPTGQELHMLSALSEASTYTTDQDQSPPGKQVVKAQFTKGKGTQSDTQHTDCFLLRHGSKVPLVIFYYHSKEHPSPPSQI